MSSWKRGPGFASATARTSREKLPIGWRTASRRNKRAVQFWTPRHGRDGRASRNHAIRQLVSEALDATEGDKRPKSQSAWAAYAHETPMKPLNRARTRRHGTARKALKLLARPFSRIVYTERVGGSNPSPPTSLRSRELRLGKPDLAASRRAFCWCAEYERQLGGVSPQKSPSSRLCHPRNRFYVPLVERTFGLLPPAGEGYAESTGAGLRFNSKLF
jgi:hypothetical protein